MLSVCVKVRWGNGARSAAEVGIFIPEFSSSNFGLPIWRYIIFVEMEFQEFFYQNRHIFFLGKGLDLQLIQIGLGIPNVS